MRILKRGSRGSDVRDLQNRLKNLGYDPGPIDGIFGPKTEAAVKKFQQDNGLVVDGIVGPKTYAALYQHDKWYVSYTIKSGDTLYAIARQYNIPLTLLLAANPGINPYQLYPGQIIKVPQGRRLLFTGWIPYWTQEIGFHTVKEYPDIFTELSPFWYGAMSTGELTLYPNAEDSDIISFARSRGINLVPLISNEFNGQLVSAILRDPTLRQAHITNIVNKTKQMNYDGIEINYENLLVADRDLFTSFIGDLTNALHAIGKYLVVTVHGKASDTGVWSGALAQDYGGLGQVADLVRIMAYDYHWFGGDPGPIAPVSWVKEVVDYALERIPLHKIILALPNYGYDWLLGGAGRSVNYNQAVATAATFNVPIIQDRQNGPHYTYTAPDGNHEVWFIDGPYLANLIDIALSANIPGIALWSIGEKDPLYDVFRSKVKQ